MDDRDARAIEELFGKLSEVERQSVPRDPEAERYIRQQIAAQPGAPYYMAQTIIVQEQALAAAQRRIEELEHGAAGRTSGGGFLSGVFGSGRPAASRGTGSYGRPADYGRSADHGGAGPWGGGYRGGGGGFLAAAAQTAMGVAGGVLLGNAVAGMLGSGAAGTAEAATPAAGSPAQDAAAVGHGLVDASADGDDEF